MTLTRTGFTLDAGLFPLRVLRHGWTRVTPAFIQATCPPRRPDEEISQVHADLAAALQERTGRPAARVRPGPPPKQPHSCVFFI